MSGGDSSPNGTNQADSEEEKRKKEERDAKRLAYVKKCIKSKKAGEVQAEQGAHTFNDKKSVFYKQEKENWEKDKGRGYWDVDGGRVDFPSSPGDDDDLRSNSPHATHRSAPDPTLQPPQQQQQPMQHRPPMQPGMQQPMQQKQPMHHGPLIQPVSPTQPMQPPQQQSMQHMPPMQPRQPPQPKENNAHTAHGNAPQPPQPQMQFATIEDAKKYLNSLGSQPRPKVVHVLGAPLSKQPGASRAKKRPPSDQPGTSRSHKRAPPAPMGAPPSSPPGTSQSHYGLPPPLLGAPFSNLPSTSQAQNGLPPWMFGAPFSGQPGTSLAQNGLPPPLFGAPFSNLPSTSQAQSALPPWMLGAPLSGQPGTSQAQNRPQLPVVAPLPKQPAASSRANKRPSDQPATSGPSHKRAPPPLLDAPPSLLVRAKNAREMHASLPDTEPFTEVSKAHTFGDSSVVVTIGEIRRRMGSPEKMGWDAICRLTRNSKKSKPAFNRMMTKYGFEFDEYVEDPNAALTISMLLEEDAVTLAQDFRKLVSAELSRSILASVVTVRASGFAIVEEAQGISKLLSQARTYLWRPDTLNDAEATAVTRRFSLATHGFGPLAATAVIDSLILVIEAIKQRPLPNGDDFAPVIVAPMSAADAAAAVCFTTDKVDIHKKVDLSLLNKQPDDHIPFCDALPRIGYDCDTIQLTRGEIRRRGIGPEKIKVPFFHKYLRRAKCKGTMADLRKDLEAIGISAAAAAKSKQFQQCSWTCISEQECMAMAKETNTALSRLPPSKALLQAVRELPAAAALIKVIAEAVGTAMLRVGESPREPKVETEIDLHVLRFALISHHFGHSFYAFVMSWLIWVMAS